MPGKVRQHINQNEQLLFEMSSPGKIGHQLPDLDVPAVDPAAALGPGNARAEIEDFPEVSEVEPIVKGRPQRLVRVAEVVAVVVGTAQVDRGQRDAADALLMELSLARRAFFSNLPAPAEPQPARAVGQGFADSHGQAACRRLARIAHAVRDDDQATHICVSQGRDSRIAPFTMPTIE